MTAGPVLCPALNPKNPTKLIITSTTVKHLKLSTELRTPGTAVTLDCHESYKLVPATPKVITCLPTGKWNRVIPKCEIDAPPNKTSVTTSSTLSTDEKIIVGVTSGVGGIILIILAVLVLMEIRLHRRREKSKSGNSSTVTPKHPMTRSSVIDSSVWENRSDVYGYREGKFNPFPVGEHQGRPRLGLTAITVPTTSQSIQDPYLRNESEFNFPHHSRTPEPLQDYDDFPDVHSTTSHRYIQPRYDHLYSYSNKSYEQDYSNIGSYHAQSVNNLSEFSLPHARRYIPTPVPTSRVSRWASLDNINAGPRFERDAGPRFERDRLSRTFDRNDPYLWRPMASINDGRYYTGTHLE